MTNSVHFVAPENAHNTVFADRALISLREETLQQLLDARQTARDARNEGLSLNEDGLAAVRRLGEMWHSLCQPPRATAMFGQPGEMLVFLMDQLCAVLLSNPPIGTDGLAVCSELMYISGELMEGMWFE